MRFTDKVVVVTGAAQGIGAVVAHKIAAEGGSVVLADRSELVIEVCAELPAGGARARYFLCDLETYAGAADLMAYAVAEFGRIDILINNVGGTIWAKPYEHYQEDEIEAEVRRSLFPTLWCCRAVLPHMVERTAGVIVNVSSIATRSINRVPYAAAKGGVNALTASLAFEAASNGIRVVATAPGGTAAPPRKVPRNPNAQSAEGGCGTSRSWTRPPKAPCSNGTARWTSKPPRSCSWPLTTPVTSPVLCCRWAEGTSDNPGRFEQQQ